MSSVRRYVTSLVLLLFCMSMFAQDSTHTLDTETGIEITAFVKPDPVALNRNATLTVRLMWYGQLDRYDVHPLDTPIVENFEIKGSGSANRIDVRNGRQTAIREYTFTLNPQAMGMAYVEGLIVTYTDLKSDKDFRLVTDRIPVKVTEAVKESETWPWFVWLIMGLVVIGGSGAIWFIYKRRQKTALPDEENAPELEQIFKDELESKVDLDDPNINQNEAFVYLSRLLRRFLAQKFKLAGLEATTHELMDSMESNGFSDSFMESVKAILVLADAVKFSGKRIEKRDLDQCYLQIESILDKCSRNETASFYVNKQNNSTNE